MNKTISISLAGFSFIIEEQAYEKLNAYLQALRNSLEKDEADEVMYDIEIRIAEIFRENLDKREVVNSDDVEKVIAQLGTPEAIEGQSEENVGQETSQEKTQDSRCLRGIGSVFWDGYLADEDYLDSGVYFHCGLCFCGSLCHFVDSASRGRNSIRFSENAGKTYQF